MTTTIATITLALTLAGSGQCPDPAHCPYHHQHYRYSCADGPGRWVLPPGPGDGWGFPNNNPDGYGWNDPGQLLPLGADRTAEYYVPRYYMVPLDQAFMGTYYNPYVNRGQRYLPYTGNGGCHPMGGPPLDTARTQVRPYSSLSNDRAVVRSTETEWTR